LSDGDIQNSIKSFRDRNGYKSKYLSAFDEILKHIENMRHHVEYVTNVENNIPDLLKKYFIVQKNAMVTKFAAYEEKNGKIPIGDESTKFIDNEHQIVEKDIAKYNDEFPDFRLVRIGELFKKYSSLNETQIKDLFKKYSSLNETQFKDLFKKYSSLNETQFKDLFKDLSKDLFNLFNQYIVIRHNLLSKYVQYKSKLDEYEARLSEYKKLLNDSDSLYKLEHELIIEVNPRLVVQVKGRDDDGNPFGGSTTAIKILLEHYARLQQNPNTTVKVYLATVGASDKDDIGEMFMTVTTTDKSPVFSNMGINRDFIYLLDDETKPISRGLSMKLHKFVSRKMSEIYNNKRFLVSSPMESMEKIMEHSGVKVFHSNKTFSKNIKDSDKIIYKDKDENQNETLKIRSPNDTDFSNPILDIQYTRDGRINITSVKINGDTILEVDDYKWLISGDIVIRPLIAIETNQLN